MRTPAKSANRPKPKPLGQLCHVHTIDRAFTQLNSTARLPSRKQHWGVWSSMPTYDARAWLGVTRSRRDAGRHASTEYAISVTAPDPATGLAHIVRAWRRYGEFDRLRKRLIAEAPDEIVSKLPFPSSRTLRKNSDSVRRRRQEQLNTWWQTIITMDAPAVTRQLDQFAVFEIRELMQAEEDARLADIRGSSLDLIVQGAGWNDLSVGRQNLYTPLGVAHQRLAFAKVTHSRVGDPYLQARWDNDVLQEIAKLLVSTLGRHGNLWFEYDGIPFGQSGLLYHLGTAANSHPWSNPCGWRHKRAPLTGVLGMNTIAGVTHYGASAPQRLLRGPIPSTESLSRRWCRNRMRLVLGVQPARAEASEHGDGGTVLGGELRQPTADVPAGQPHDGRTQLVDGLRSGP